MVGSFRLALTDWLETRLSVRLYVTAGVLRQNLSWVKIGLSAPIGVVAERSFADRTSTAVGIDVDAPDFGPGDSIIDATPALLLAGPLVVSVSTVFLPTSS
ncbi:MAG: hypothetical protein CM15mP103_08780 [Gammaproteobacteria bacterium]|nr:MAG: hypothetical protein CM15mP103_08780 [Gammaproteobacteria bacterium]